MGTIQVNLSCNGFRLLTPLKAPQSYPGANWFQMPPMAMSWSPYQWQNPSTQHTSSGPLAGFSGGNAKGTGNAPHVSGRLEGPQAKTRRLRHNLSRI